MYQELITKYVFFKYSKVSENYWTVKNNILDYCISKCYLEIIVIIQNVYTFIQDKSERPICGEEKVISESS